MKNKKFLTILIALSFLIVSPAAKADEVITVEAKGLVCDFCARSLEKLFLKQEQVADISVNLDTKLITIRLKEDQVLDDEIVTKLVLDSGYSISTITRQSDENAKATP